MTTKENTGLYTLRLNDPCLFRAKLTSTFTDERSYGCHGGIDLAPRNKRDGLYLQPVFDGIVDFVGQDNKTGMGNYCRIRSEFNGITFYHWYLHLDDCFLRAGAEAPTQWMLGIAGQSGNATGRHLHLAIQVPFYGRAGCGIPSVVDPLQFFDANTVAAWR